MAANNTGMHNLTTLIKRLEAATSRLEDIASSTIDASQPQSQPKGAAALPSSGAAVTTGGDGAATRAPTGSGVAEDVPDSIKEYDAVIDGPLKTFHELSTSSRVGGLRGEQAEILVKAFKAQRSFLLAATKAKQPDPGSPAFADSLKDTFTYRQQVEEIREKNRAPVEIDTGLRMVGNGAEALLWVLGLDQPKSYIAEAKGGAQFYGNKIRNSDETQKDWVMAFEKILDSLKTYVEKYHQKGVTWNPQGVDIATAIKEVQSKPSSAVASAGSVPPPPPGPPPSGKIPPPPGPPPPPGSLPPLPQAKAAGGGDMGAVFADLNKGSDVTRGLKKVDASQMTHKNPALRGGSTVPQRSDSSSSAGRGPSPAPPGKKPKPENLRTKKPAKKELDGNKWIIENFENNPSPLEIEAEISQSILITKCKATTIRIHGKANAVSIDNSPKCSLILDSLVAGLDVIKCASFALQVVGTVPTVSLDQVDGGTIYLSPETVAVTELFTSKCSSVNVNLPPGSADEGAADYREVNVPEQLRSFVSAGTLVTEIVEHAG